MIEYNNLKLEYKSNYLVKNTTHNLAFLMSKYFHKSIESCILLININLKITSNPVNFLRSIEAYK